MGVSKYVARRKTFWRVDTYVTLPDGSTKRVKRGHIPTREQAEAHEHKLPAEAYEGRFFDRAKEPTATVRQLWAEYEPVTRRERERLGEGDARAPTVSETAPAALVLARTDVGLPAPAGRQRRRGDRAQRNVDRLRQRPLPVAPEGVAAS